MKATDLRVLGDFTLAFSRLSYNRENDVFVKAAEGAAVLSGGISSRADILTCKCVLNYQKRVKTPCILVLKKGEGEKNFQYSLFTLSSDRLELCLEFRLPYELRENVRVLGGPAVMWRQAGDVCFISAQTGAVRRLPVQVQHCVFGELPLCKGNVFVIGGQELSSARCVSPNPGHFIESGHTFDGNMILPQPYISLTQCMLILSTEKTDCNKVVQSAVVVATSRQQLVYFENGVVKNACQLPFEQPNNIQLVDTGRSGSMFVISFQKGHACAVWKETFQIAEQWSNVDSVHVGDFLGCGTEQMLLIFKGHSVAGQPLDKFLLTDLCGITCAVRSVLYQLNLFMSYMHAAHDPVLNACFREASLMKLQRLCVFCVLLSHTSLLITGFSLSVQEGLIALWDCDEESKENALDGETAVVPAVSSNPQLDRLWHRIFEDRLLVGVMLTTTSDANDSSVEIYCHPLSYGSLLRCQVARKRNFPLELAVTAVTRLTPLLNSACVKCSVMLRYIQKHDAFAPLSDLNVDIKLLNILLFFCPEEAKEDLLSLLTVLDHWVFLIDSPDYSLGDLESWIQKRFDCKRIELSHQYYYLDSPESSTSMLLHWCPISPFRGELSIKMLQFLDSFLNFLPVSCSIRPVKNTQGQTAAQTFSLVLEKEDKTSQEHEAPEPGSAMELQGWRELWQLDVEESRKRLHPLVDVGRYRSLMQRVNDVQQNVDLVALLDTQRTLLN
uniref:FA complementation group B n=1 Tax=Takifugu rubripes TaxID=31033 RepID=H2TF09_TAKRU